MPSRGAKAGAMLLEDTADDGGQEGALVGEVVVDGRLGARRLWGDVVQRRTAHAALAPEPIGGLKHPTTGGRFPRLLSQARHSTYRSVALGAPPGAGRYADRATMPLRMAGDSVTWLTDRERQRVLRRRARSSAAWSHRRPPVTEASTRRHPDVT